MNIAGVVLAAGLGTRMKSSLPKVLHRLQGLPMLYYVFDTLRRLNAARIVVVVGERSEAIRESLQDVGAISFAEQKEAKGTGDALSKSVPFLRGFQGTVLVVNGDTPLITEGTLRSFLARHKKKRNDVSLLSFIAGDPGSYGRVIRDSRGRVTSIIEDRHTTELQKRIREVNSGVYAIETLALHLLKEIKINKSKGEYYLTDIIRIAREKGLKTDAFCTGSEEEFIGVNTREELEKAQQLIKDRNIKKWLERGVCFMDSGSVFVSSTASIGKDTVVYPNVHLEGNTRIGRGCTIYPNVRILDSTIGDHSVIKDSSLIEGSVVRKRATVGPFAHIRPGSEIGEGAKIGNFVEIKKSVIGSGTKASHLTYLGDAKIGKGVNIGAGTITCNYDGNQKYVTTINDDVFIGSDAQLIAPVRVGKGAYVGAGSTITKDVPARALALSRVAQINIENWATRRKSKVKGEKLRVKKGEKK